MKPDKEQNFCDIIKEMQKAIKKQNSPKMCSGNIGILCTCYGMTARECRC